MLIRDRCGRLYESYSNDDGRRWPQPWQTRFISSDSPATTCRLADGRIVLVWNSCQRWDNPHSYAMGGREVLHMAISADEGETWRGFREVLVCKAAPRAEDADWGTAYPSAVETAEGKILLTSGQGSYGRAIVLLDPEHLTQTSASDDFSDGLAQWTMYYVEGYGLVDHPDRPGSKALCIRKTSPDVQSGAVWNFPCGHIGRLDLRLMLQPGFGGAHVSLTDHFAAADDLLSDANAVFSFQIDENGVVAPGHRLSAGQWRDLSVEWDTARDEAIVSVDGKRTATLRTQRVTETGVNYLRLRSAASSTDTAGFLIEEVRAEVT